ncbi:MAG: PKD domain-containing protein [Candidatus Sumerlaeota bacterium]
MSFSRGEICRVTSIIALLLFGAFSGAQTLSNVSPAMLNADSNAIFTVNGTGLSGYDTFTIQKLGGAALPLAIASQTSTAVQCEINLAGQPVGLYNVTASGPSMPVLHLNSAFEASRSQYLELTRTTLGSSELPFAAGTLFSNTQVLIPQSEIGPAGLISQIRFYALPGAPNPTRTLTVRIKHTTSTSLGLTSLESTGWTVAYSGSFPTIAADHTLTINCTDIFSYDGAQNLMLSFLDDNTALDFGNYYETFETGSNRLVMGRSNSSTPPSSSWSGSVPSSRLVRTQIPKMRLRLAGVQPTAGFSAATQNPVQNSPVLFTNGTTFAGAETPAYAWDFDGDGITDSTNAFPTFAWPTPGVYTVELITTVGYTQDSETKVNYITVSPASCVDWTLVEMD